jgi:hypothetical protein
MTLAAMMAVWLACQLSLPPSGDFHNERTLDEVLRAHGPPLFSARAAATEQPRWVLWGRFVPVRAERLVASDVQLVDPDKRPRPAGRVLVYCEGNVRNGWARLELWALVVRAEMERATPFLDDEGPGKRLLQVGSGKGGRSRYAYQTDPIRVTLVSVDGKGAVTRIATTRIRELSILVPSKRQFLHRIGQ